MSEDTLGTRLSALLESKKVTQSQLARRLGIDQTAISRIIVRENYQPGAFQLYKIAKTLGTSVDSLLDGIITVEEPVSVDTSLVARFGNEIAELQKGQAQLTNALTEMGTAIRQVSAKVDEIAKPKVKR